MTTNREEEVRLAEVGRVLTRAKDVALEYESLTRKPLGITGEVGEYEAARLLGLRLAEAREPGFDVIGPAGPTYGSTEVKFQVKTRRVRKRDAKKGQRIGSIRLEHKWDAVLLVLLDDSFNTTEIFRADRAAIKKELRRPGSISRNERGALAVSKFKSISIKVWPTGD